MKCLYVFWKLASIFMRVKSLPTKVQIDSIGSNKGSFFFYFFKFFFAIFFFKLAIPSWTIPSVSTLRIKCRDIFFFNFLYCKINNMEEVNKVERKSQNDFLFLLSASLNVSDVAKGLGFLPFNIRMI